MQINRNVEILVCETVIFKELHLELVHIAEIDHDEAKHDFYTDRISEIFSPDVFLVGSR